VHPTNPNRAEKEKQRTHFSISFAEKERDDEFLLPGEIMQKSLQNRPWPPPLSPLAGAAESEKMCDSLSSGSAVLIKFARRGRFLFLRHIAA
jgi:hypothetical protein